MNRENVLKVLVILSALTCILGIVKLTAEALSLGTHKYFDVSSEE